MRTRAAVKEVRMALYRSPSAIMLPPGAAAQSRKRTPAVPTEARGAHVR